MLNMTEKLERAIASNMMQMLAEKSESAPYTIKVGYNSEGSHCHHNGFVILDSSHATLERLYKIAEEVREDRDEVSIVLIRMSELNKGLLVTVSCYNQANL